MTILRCTTSTHLPASLEQLNATELPLGFTITPLGPIIDERNERANGANAASKTSTSSCAVIGGGGIIPKCQECGATLNPECLIQPPANERDNGWPSFVCALCGNSSSFEPSIQLQYLRDDDNEEEEEVTVTECDERYRTRYREDLVPLFSGYRRYGRNANPHDLPSTSTKRGLPTEMERDLVEYELVVGPPVQPLDGPWPTQHEWIDNARRTLHCPSVVPSPTLALNAVECPALLLSLVYLPSNTSDTLPYLEAVGNSMRYALSNRPSNYPALAGLFVVSDASVSVFDLSCATPHVKHFFLEGADDDDEHSGAATAAFDLTSSSFGLENVLCPISGGGCGSDALECALRALTEFVPPPPNGSPLDPASKSGSGSSASAAIGRGLQAVLDFLDESGAVHPGIIHNDPEDDTVLGGMFSAGTPNEDQPHSSPLAFPYAGGKVLIYTCGTTTPTPSVDNSDEMNGDVGTGGLHGYSGPVGERGLKRFPDGEDNTNTSTHNQTTDVFQIISEDPEELYQRWDALDQAWIEQENERERERERDTTDSLELGHTACRMALGVEILGINAAAASPNVTSPPCFDIATLRHLSEQSGGYGPVIVTLPAPTTTPTNGAANEQNGSGNGLNTEAQPQTVLNREVLSRSPWGGSISSGTNDRPCAFGTMMRIRTSPQIKIISSNTRNAGMYGHCTNQHYHLEDDGYDDDVPPLWQMGSCHGDTTLACEITILGDGSDGDGIVDENKEPYIGATFENHRGSIKTFSPCVQTVFAYTAIVPKTQNHHSKQDVPQTIGVGETPLGDEECLEWVTVRRVRVLTKTFRLAQSPEALTWTLDADVLAVLLFHKWLKSSQHNGLSYMHHTGKEFLLNVLKATYKSAKDTHAHMVLDNKGRYGQIEQNTDDYENRFYVADRLLEQPNAQISDRDILLAQGHDRVCALPLLVFALLQCDAFRMPVSIASTTHSRGRPFFLPNLDARWASVCNMATMKPDDLSRLLAPRLELWSSLSSPSPLPSSPSKLYALSPFAASQLPTSNAHDGTEISSRPILEGLSLNYTAIEAAICEFENYNTEQITFPVLLLDTPRQILIYAPSRMTVNSDSAGSKEQMRKSLVLATKDVILAAEEASKTYRIPPSIYLNPDDAPKRLEDMLIEDWGLVGLLDDGGATYEQEDSKKAFSLLDNYEDFLNDIASVLCPHVDG